MGSSPDDSAMELAALRAEVVEAMHELNNVLATIMTGVSMATRLLPTDLRFLDGGGARWMPSRAHADPRIVSLRAWGRPVGQPGSSPRGHRSAAAESHDEH